MPQRMWVLCLTVPWHGMPAGEKIIWRLQPEIGPDGQVLAAGAAGQDVGSEVDRKRSKAGGQGKQLQQQPQQPGKGRRPDRAMSPMTSSRAETPRGGMRFTLQQQQQQQESAASRSRRQLKRPERYRDTELMPGEEEEDGDPAFSAGLQQQHQQYLQQPYQPSGALPAPSVKRQQLGPPGPELSGSPPRLIMRSPPPKNVVASRGLLPLPGSAGAASAAAAGARRSGFFPVPSKNVSIKVEPGVYGSEQQGARHGLQLPGLAPSGLQQQQPQLRVRIPDPAAADPEAYAALQTQHGGGPAITPAAPEPRIQVAFFNAQLPSQAEAPPAACTRSSSAPQVGPAPHLGPAQRAAVQRLNARLQVLAMVQRKVAAAAAAMQQPLPSPTAAAAAAAAVLADAALTAEPQQQQQQMPHGHDHLLAGHGLERASSMERMFASPAPSSPRDHRAGMPDLLLAPGLGVDTQPPASASKQAAMPTSGALPHLTSPKLINLNAPGGLATVALSQGMTAVPLLAKPSGAMGPMQLAKGWPGGQLLQLALPPHKLQLAAAAEAAGKNNFRPPGSPALAAGLGAPGLLIPPGFAVPGSAQPSPAAGPLAAGPLAAPGAAATPLTDLKPCEIDDLLMDLDGPELRLE